MSLLLLFNQFGATNTTGPTVLMPGKAHGSAFTRKRFDELTAAWLAQEALDAKAKESTGKRRQALEVAAKQAEDALLAFEEAEAEVINAQEAAELVSFTNAMKAAESAKYVADVVRTTNAVRDQAQAMHDDEEEAISLLLLNG